MSSPSAKLEVSPSPCFPCAPYRAEPAPPPPPPHFPICDSPFLPLETSDCSHRIRIHVENFWFPETDGAEIRKTRLEIWIEGIVFFGCSRRKKSRIRWMASPKETFSQVFKRFFGDHRLPLHSSFSPLCGSGPSRRASTVNYTHS